MGRGKPCPYEVDKRTPPVSCADKDQFAKGGLAALNTPYIDAYGIFLVTMLCVRTRV